MNNCALHYTYLFGFIFAAALLASVLGTLIAARIWKYGITWDVEQEKGQ